eukprot:6212915-Pleurochrysis_carterae.AAC.2
MSSAAFASSSFDKSQSAFAQSAFARPYPREALRLASLMTCCRLSLRTAFAFLTQRGSSGIKRAEQYLKASSACSSRQTTTNVSNSLSLNSPLNTCEVKPMIRQLVTTAASESTWNTSSQPPMSLAPQ